MSGHSHWKQIKHQKGAADVKRAQLFSKLLAAVTVAARVDPNPQFNPRLKAMIEKAKENSVPAENIDRAIKRSSETKPLEEVAIEAYGPEGAALMIEGVTDNKNRTIAEIRAILSDFQAKMAEPGSVRWLFDSAGGIPPDWEPKFEQLLSPEAHGRLRELITALNEHNDVQRVITNAQK